MLEREAELELVLQALGRVGEGTGGALLIEGPPGIGKTTLLEHALAGTSLKVLRARGSELEAALTFGVVRDLLGPALRAMSPSQRDELFAGPARLAGRVLGFGGDEDDLVDPLYSLYWLVSELAEQESLVLAIDDLHWIDEESGRFVEYLARRIEGQAVLLTATARPNEPGAPEAVTQFAAVAQVVRPRPLTRVALARLVPERDPEAVLRATGGNPLLATELARVPAAVPLEEVGLARVAEIVLRRVERLSDEAARLARAVSVFAEDATLEDASAVAGLSAEEAARAADALIVADILNDGDRLAFAHPVMRTAVYEQLGTFARRRGHAAAARALRERGAPAETVAAHLLNSAPQRDPDNLRILRRAAEQALVAAAPRAAIRYLERALEEPVPPGPDRARVLHELGCLRARVGRLDAAAVLEEAVAAGAGPDAILDLCAVLLVAGLTDEALARLLRVRENAELDAEQRLLADALVCCVAAFSFDTALLAETRRRLPSDLPGATPAQRAVLAVNGSFALADGLSAGDAFEIARRSVDAQGRVPYGEFGLLYFEPIPAFIKLEQFDALEALAEKRMARARERGDEAMFVSAVLARGACSQLRGRWLAAEADVRQALAHPVVTPEQRWQASDILAESLTRQLRLEEAEAAVTELAVAGDDSGPPAVRRAAIAMARGDYSQPDVFRRVADDFAAMGLTHCADRRWLCTYVECLGRQGRREEALAALAPYLEEAEEYGHGAPLGNALIELGRLQRGDAATTALRRAVDVLAPTPNEWLHGWARYELGAALRRQGQRAEAREQLRIALDYATANGERQLAGQARDELRLAGARTRRATHDRDALTPAESRIAERAAAGLTNKQIAAELFLTVGTVQMTLVKVFRKLEVASRRELPEALLQREAART